MNINNILKKVKLLDAKKHLLNLRDSDKRVKKQVDKLIEEIDEKIELIGMSLSKGTVYEKIKDYVVDSNINVNKKVSDVINREIAKKFSTSYGYVVQCLYKLRKEFARNGISKIGKYNNTSIELMMQNELCRRKIKFEKDNKKFFGNPDFFIYPNICVFCDGDYWHNYPKGTKRDKEVNKRLLEQGYSVIRFWERQIRTNVIRCGEEIKAQMKKQKIYK